MTENRPLQTPGEYVVCFPDCKVCFDAGSVRNCPCDCHCCPMCGGRTNDPAGGPCEDCWNDATGGWVDR